MAYHLLNKKQMNYGNRLDMPTSHNPKKDLYLSALADGALLDDEESPIAMSRAPAAVASPIEMPVVEYAPEAARALATAEKKKQVAIPNSGGATQDPLTGVVTLPEIFAEGAPRIPRTDVMDQIATAQAAPKVPVMIPERDSHEDWTKDTESSSTEDTQSNQNTAKNTTETKIYDPESLGERIKSAYNTPQIQALSDGLDRQEKMITDELEHPGSREVDLRGVAALIDNTYGTNYGKYLDKPTSDLERKKLLMSALDKVQDNRRDMAKSLLETVKAQEIGKNSNGNTIVELVKLMQKNGQIAQTGSSDKSTEINPDAIKLKASARNPQVNNAYEKVWDQFSKQNKSTLEGFQAIPQAQEMLKLNTSPSTGVLKRMILKLAGDSRFSDQDVQAFGGDPTLIEKANQAVETAAGSGGFSAANQAQMKALINGMVRVAKKRYDEQVKGHIDSALIAHKELDPADMQDFFYGRSGMTKEKLAAMSRDATPKGTGPKLGPKSGAAKKKDEEKKAGKPTGNTDSIDAFFGKK
jgi:hypothetical protein